MTGGGECCNIPMLSASSREKPRRSATTHAHAIMTGARFTTVNLCLSASSSKISWKSSNADAAPSESSSAAGPGKYSFFLSKSNRNDDDDDDDSDVPRVVSPPSPYLRFFRGEDDVDADADDEGGDDGSDSRFICCCFFG
jgi:hypothetical protein